MINPNKTSQYRLTIIVPVFNEESNIKNLEERLKAFLPQSLCKACVLFVDDGSTDDSLNRIKAVCARQKDFYYLALARNGGLSAALKAGIDATESAYVGYMDADLQTAPEDFNLLLPYLNDYELVTGIRAKRPRPRPDIPPDRARAPPSERRGGPPHSGSAMAPH